MVDTPIVASPGTRQRRAAGWLEIKALWAGVAIAAMWLAVLFVGIFAGDIVTTNVSGSSARVPSVIVVAFFALIATIFVGRWGFREPPAKE